MEAKIDEIGDSTYRLSIYVPKIYPPFGFTFNQFLILGEEPLLFHCGLRKMFPLVSAAVARIIPVERLRWLIFGHFEADECGSMNEWLAAAPRAQIAHGLALGIDSRFRRPAAPCAVKRRSYRHRWEARALHRHAARTAWMGCRRGLRRNHEFAVLR
jgi:ODP family beta lactamase